LEQTELVGERPDRSSDGGEEIGRASEGVAERAEPTVDAHPSTRSETPEVEGIEIEPPCELRIGGEQDLEPAIEPEPVDDVGAHPAADSIARLDDGDVDPGGLEGTGTGESGEPCSHDDDVMIHRWTI
jgi:hypothetical protein